jgi:hypothetical protein
MITRNSVEPWNIPNHESAVPYDRKNGKTAGERTMGAEEIEDSEADITL